MSKQSYKVPASLDRSYLDQEIPLSGGGFTLPPIPIKAILFYLGGGMALFWSIFNTFISAGPIWYKALFLLWGLVAIVVLGRVSKTKELRTSMIVPLLSYLPGTARKVLTRSNSAAAPFHSIVGVNEIDDSGQITFSDGRYGRAYLVVGSASVLLFEDDKKAILDRVDAFWRKIGTDAEFAFVTTKEPQRIYRQVATLERTTRNLKVRDPELLDLLDEQYDVMTKYVGKEFRSVHQYLVVMADNKEQLRQAHNVVAAEVEGSSYMIKACNEMNRDEVMEMFSVLYQGRT